MILELTDDQKAFQSTAEKFAREIVAQRAAGIDKSGEFPSDVITAAAGYGLLGVTIPNAWGGAGRDYVSYALAIEAIAKASATVAVSLSVTNSLVAEVIAHAGTRSAARALAAAAGDRRGARRLRAVRAGAGTDAANQTDPRGALR
jgi:alkylation response protein AidB-like acyl-CoA dehydrogenase